MTCRVAVTNADVPPDSPLNFGALIVLVVECNQLESDILYQVLAGFKVRRINRLRSPAEAQEYLARDQADLILVGASTSESETSEAIELVRRIRRSAAETARTVPVIMLAGHTSEENVLRARDCGVNFVLARPMTPQVLFDRLQWLSRDPRKFVVHENYVGPDRRFQNMGPPPDSVGRRKGDLSLKVGEAKGVNLSQQEIDSFLGSKPAAALV